VNFFVNSPFYKNSMILNSTSTLQSQSNVLPTVLDNTALPSTFELSSENVDFSDSVIVPEAVGPDVLPSRKGKGKGKTAL
jgi:hypothetical protein